MIEFIHNNLAGHVLAEKSKPVEFSALPTRFHVGVPSDPDERAENVVRSVVASQALSGIDARRHLGLPRDWNYGRSIHPRRDPGAPRDDYELACVHERLRVGRVRTEGDGVHVPAVVRNARFLSALVVG